MIDNGQTIFKFCNQIFPICRSITGDGVRKTLGLINQAISIPRGGVQLDIYEVPSGTRVFDWMVPKEWKIRDAFIEDESGKHIIDFSKNNLHVLGYSAPVDKWVSVDELKQYVYTQPDQPDVIPYVTSYYEERFGFCMSQNQLDSLPDGQYHMFIDSELFDGNLTYADLVIPGRSDREIFFSTYLCHPSMANDQCSGISLQTSLIKYVANLPNRRYTYRFVFVPETIGSITYMSQLNRLDHLKEKMDAGFVLACVGDDRGYGIVESKYANTLADKALNNILKNHTTGYSRYPFLNRGSDEQRYGGCNIGLPVVSFFRSKYGEYPEYHTSADNMNLVNPAGFQGSMDIVTRLVNALENNHHYKMLTYGDPQLGPRGLYPNISQKNTYDDVEDMVNFIAYAEGRNDLIDISNYIGAPVEKLIEIKDRLIENDLLTFVEE